MGGESSGKGNDKTRSLEAYYDTIICIWTISSIYKVKILALYPYAPDRIYLLI
jgi:hypothetical protein